MAQIPIANDFRSIRDSRLGGVHNVVKRRAKAAAPKYWTPVSGWGRHGEYEVSDGYVTARIGNRTKRAAASSARVLAAQGAEADKSLAMILLGEIPYDEKPSRG